MTSPQGRPASIPPGDWTAILAGVPGLRMRLGWARQEWDDGRYAAAQIFYQEARERYRVVLVAVFKHDVGQFTALLQTKPAFVTPEDWKQQLTQEPLKPILDQLAGLPATLPKTDAASAVWQAGIQGAWGQFLGRSSAVSPPRTTVCKPITNRSRTTMNTSKTRAGPRQCQKDSKT